MTGQQARPACGCTKLAGTCHRSNKPQVSAEGTPEAGRFGEAQAVEGQQLEGFRQDELATGGRCGAILAIAEELIDALPQQLVLASRQSAARDVSAHAPRRQVGLSVQVRPLEDLPQQLGHWQGQIVYPANAHVQSGM